MAIPRIYIFLIVQLKHFITRLLKEVHPEFEAVTLFPEFLLFVLHSSLSETSPAFLLVYNVTVGSTIQSWDDVGRVYNNSSEGEWLPILMKVGKKA